MVIYPNSVTCVKGYLYSHIKANFPQKALCEKYHYFEV